MTRDPLAERPTGEVSDRQGSGNRPKVPSATIEHGRRLGSRLSKGVID